MVTQSKLWRDLADVFRAYGVEGADRINDITTDLDESTITVRTVSLDPHELYRTHTLFLQADRPVPETEPTPIHDELVAENAMLDEIEEHERSGAYSHLVTNIRDADKRLRVMAQIEDAWVDVGYLIGPLEIEWQDAGERSVADYQAIVDKYVHDVTARLMIPSAQAHRLLA